MIKMILMSGMAKNYIFNTVIDSWPHSPCLLIRIEESLIYRGIYTEELQLHLLNIQRKIYERNGPFKRKWLS